MGDVNVLQIDGKPFVGQPEERERLERIAEEIERRFMHEHVYCLECRKGHRRGDKCEDEA
jgi:hypothetical protein